VIAIALALWLALPQAPDGGPGDGGVGPAGAAAQPLADPDGGRHGSLDGGPRDPDAEVIEQLDLLEQLELLEHLDLFEEPAR
jgi:hypothetical protein